MSFTLVSNILASRGIDFAGVDHVLLFDFPRDPIEYVCHVGRTAQGAGGNGMAYRQSRSPWPGGLWKGTRKAIHAIGDCCFSLLQTDDPLYLIPQVLDRCSCFLFQ
ncbi:unnamed protein product [Musa acuminata subsp. malaccensis]|nr:unnamed protein product [Musa acuminata subsp. malaccensis]